MSKELHVLEMQALSDDQWKELRQLKVSERQEVFGKSFCESIEDWELAAKDEVLGLCFLIEEIPVGLVLFRKQVRHEAGNISVHGLKISIPWQRQGYGHQAFRQAVEYAKWKWPDARKLNLAVDAENRPAVAVYRGFGMADSGPVFDGPNGKEHRMETSMRL